MSKTKLGILGPISGKVGPVVGGFWKGEPYLRAVSSKPAKPATPSQLVVRAKFKMASDVVKHLMPFVTIGYSVYKLKTTQRNMAMRQILLEAIEGEYPNFVIDYSKVKLSEGSFPGVSGGDVQCSQPARLDFRWVFDSNNPKEKPTDSFMVAVYAPELGSAIVHTSLEIREKERASLSLPMTFSGQEVHLWAAFVDSAAMIRKAKPEAVSNSTYLGSVTIL